MGSFLPAYAKLRQKEGGWANHRVDRGGETWRGIARRKNPRWVGWLKIDKARTHPMFPANLEKMLDLESDVTSFYEKNYWYAVSGSALPQEVAEEMFDAAVNCGVGNAVRFAQVAANLLNRNQKLYNDINVDGKMGRDTRGAIADCLNKRGLQWLLVFMRQVRGNYYMDILVSDPEQEEFALSWFGRLNGEV